MQKKISDMKPRDIKILLMQKDINQADIARAIGVRPQLVSNVINGKAMSHKVCLEIALRTNTDIKRLWPSRYLYHERPKRGQKLNIKGA
jgi:lambda repressor-like predicted transcriptional regulator